MSSGVELVEVLNQETGTRERHRRRILENPAIVKPGLFVEVDVDQKPYLPEMFKDRTFAEPAPKTDEADEALDEED